MADIAIRVEGLSKRYKIGRAQERHDTLRDLLVDAIRSPFRKNGGTEGSVIWALKDVSFEVPRGEVLGIIGRNGAGKSTLLKILSRITEPTEGRVEIHGRVGSLLEVGTGFHPELTGRENIYLNGAILGMRRAEIDRKFDEIVAFAEIEKFLDTPVKHYSSGMYVRLAFAVAAHLEPEILLVDEVLAVGDAAFQKKCLGKMGNVAQEGRTVLFVSHNVGAVRALCSCCVLLTDGYLALQDRANQVINHYLSFVSGDRADSEIRWQVYDTAPGSDEFRLRGIRLIGPAGDLQSAFDMGQPINVEITYETRKSLRGMRLILSLITQEGSVVFMSTDHSMRSDKVFPPGWYRTCCAIPGKLLNRGMYHIRISCGIPGIKKLMPGQEWLSFTVEGSGTYGSYFPESWSGVVAPALKWRTDQITKQEIDA